MQIDLGEIYNLNDYDELARMFLKKGEFDFRFTKIDKSEGTEKKDENKRRLYDSLSTYTGKVLPWGILTGVKPVKLYSQLADLYGSDRAMDLFKTRYLVDNAKSELVGKIYELQKKILHPPKPNEVAIYLGIPFCPTKCAYCTFTSHVGSRSDRETYLNALIKEIKFVGNSMRDSNMVAESIYVGGGTPTALDADELDNILSCISTSFPAREGTELCVEAGRPDTIDAEKTAIMINNNVGRISINPQSLNEKTLEKIGRSHTNKDIDSAFNFAKKCGINDINADVIAGLPGETLEDFENTISKLLKYEPSSITVHTLSIKRGSGLQQDDPFYSYNQKGIASQMLDYAERVLNENHMKPYYLYRQKQMVDNLENIGYANQGAECIYNVRIMEEKQTIIALGAGASSKLYFPEIDRIERIFNVADYKLYADRIDEMIERKKRIFIDVDKSS